MDLWYWFTNLDGRINRLPYWLGSLTLLAGAVALVVILTALFGAESLPGRRDSRSNFCSACSCWRFRPRWR